MNSYLLTQNRIQINHEESLHELEAGRVLFFPDCYYAPVESSLMSESILSGKHKNVSYDYKRRRLGAFKKNTIGLANQLEHLMRGYAVFAHELVRAALPSYIPFLQWGRTSFRPAQICGRATSKRKDDSRLHVDSFAATPVNGLRILRIFCNINPQKEPRVWNLGEAFPQVLLRFAPQIRPYSKWRAKILQLVKSTKTLRSPYDHYMLALHDKMKMDDLYQKNVEKTQIQFPAQSSWIVFTDQVSHAALSGQHVLEQTFYLPVDKMNSPELSPWSEWKKYRQDLHFAN